MHMHACYMHAHAWILHTAGRHVHLCMRLHMRLHMHLYACMHVYTCIHVHMQARRQAQLAENAETSAAVRSVDEEISQVRQSDQSSP